ncbi:unnamed protein product [Polarella glacialis]|uniref:RanBP2-type domain-containing protein n=1 Tax=Polarella glacialis TaxID=89957 RepID=A0A813K0H8_POLGL|nr:unnamed protein product [Polarella glacialis]
MDPPGPEEEPQEQLPFSCTSLGAAAAEKFAECVFCFEPLPSVRLCVLRKAGRRACRHVHHLDCMRRDADFVRRHSSPVHGGRSFRCPLCNAPYDNVVAVPPVGEDASDLFSLVVRQRTDRILAAQDVKDLLRAMFWLDDTAVDALVDTKWPEAVGHEGVADAQELLRLVRLAGSTPGQARELEPPLLVDDAAGWFNFWAGDASGLTRDTLLRALIKTLGTGDAEREELRAAVFAVWGLFSGDADSISCADFVAAEGMADALLAAIVGGSAVPPSDLCSAPAGLWRCARCTLHNADSEMRCVACEAAKPHTLRDTNTSTSSVSAVNAIGADISRPLCHLCSATLTPARIGPSSGGTSTSCACCRRRPSTGAAVWCCDWCQAALCVRCATVAIGGRASAQLRSHASSENPAVAERLTASPSARSEEEVLSEVSVEIGGAADAGAATMVRCLHCQRMRSAFGVGGGRWCRCPEAGDSSSGPRAEVEAAPLPVLGGSEATTEEVAEAVLPPVEEASASEVLVPGVAEVAGGDLALPGSSLPDAAAKCSNCNRLQAPETSEGYIGSKKWCQCNSADAPNAALREHLRDRQLLRTSMNRSARGADASAGPPGPDGATV